MASIASAPPWNAEDDLLLRHAVEAGASLEALARGAVLFSRRFSVQELQDRWRSLLYDADVSEQASERMTQFELANPNVSFKATKFGISKFGGKSSAVKRKGESVRRLYYEMRKRLCSFNTFGMNFINEPIPHNDGDENMNIDNGVLDESYMVGDHVEDYFELVDDEKHDPCLLNGDPVLNDDNNDNDDSKCDIVGQSSGDGLVEFPNCQSVEALGASHIMQDMPLWKTMEDISAPEMPIDAALDVKIQKAVEDKVSSPEYNTDPGCEINSLVSLSGDDFANISDSLLNFSHENEHVAMDVGCENLDDKSRDVSDKPVESSAQTSGNENDAQKAVQPETSDPKTTSTVVSEDVKNAQKNDSSSVLRLSDGKQDVAPETNTPSISTLPGPCSPDFYFELMECTLNTEDPEIPCNDEPGVTESSAVVLPLKDQKNVVQESFSSKKGENIAASVPSQILGHRTAPKTNQSLKVVGSAVKSEPSDGRCLASSSGSQFRSAASLKFSANHGLKQEGIKPPVTMTKENAIVIREPSAIEAEHLEPEKNPSPLYIDESEEELDREIDIPYFSDIENMILEMDLSPDDEESRFREKVSRYQCEDAKRKIIRLEQCSRTSTQRAIASKGALAVLYGRHLKRYIKKTEVILGRATEDNEVDIDLGEEGRASKISRRQALIKLEGDGSFFLKNIGKSSIFLNGKEVATGHRMCLSSSNLIEITGLSFVFEMNHKSIKRYLENLGQNSRGKYTKLEWSPTRRNQ